jgi:hypothetical protein|nr:MAG TPA: hypothetical protein [Caudoviricetes sp.]
MPKLRTKKILPPERQFLAFPDHYVNLPGKIAFAELAKLATTDEATYGEKSGKVIARGTLVHMDADGNVTKPTYSKTVTDGTKANAVLFNTIDIEDFDAVTDPYVNAAVLVHGFVRKDRLIGDKENLDFSDLIHVVNN